MDEDAQIKSFHIEYELNATVTINGDSWVKPGVKSGIAWNNIPKAEVLRRASTVIVEDVLEPTLADIIELVIEKTSQADLRSV